MLNIELNQFELTLLQNSPYMLSMIIAWFWGVEVQHYVPYVQTHNGLI